MRDDNNGRNESGLNVPKPGCHRLAGNQALALARSRYFQYQDKAGRWHADPGTDLGRIRRQQTMLRALAAKAAGRNLANPLRANALVGSVVRSLTKDDRLSIRRSVTLARQFRSFDPARLNAATLPVERAVQRDGVVRRDGQPGFEQGRRQGWEQILLPREPDAKATVAKFLSRPKGPVPRAPATTAPAAQPSPPPAPSKVAVTVKNATSRQGLAARATASLRRLGFKAINGGNATPSAKTTLFHAEGSDAAATVAARAVRLGGGRGRPGPPGRPRARLGRPGAGSGLQGPGQPGRGPQAAPSRPPSPPRRPGNLPSWDPRPADEQPGQAGQPAVLQGLDRPGGLAEDRGHLGSGQPAGHAQHQDLALVGGEPCSMACRRAPSSGLKAGASGTSPTGVQPCSRASATASSLVCTPSLASRFSVWTWTALSDTTQALAMRRRTSRWPSCPGSPVPAATAAPADQRRVRRGLPGPVAACPLDDRGQVRRRFLMGKGLLETSDDQISEAGQLLSRHRAPP